MNYQIAALSIFNKIRQKCILFGQYYLTQQTPGFCFYYCA